MNKERIYLKNLSKFRLIANANGKNISQQDIGNVIGLGRQSISFIESQKQTVSLEQAEEISKFLNCSIDDLKGGIESIDLTKDVDITPHKPQNIIKVKYFKNIEACAGSCDIDNDCEIFHTKEVDTETLDYLTGSIKLNSGKNKNLSMIRVNGDSMSSVLSDGNWVIVDHNQKNPSESKDIFLIKTEYGLYLKYVIQYMDGKIKVMSEKEGFPVYEIHKNDEKPDLDFRVLGRVIAINKGV